MLQVAMRVSSGCSSSFLSSMMEMITRQR